jgi:hypothetical protein
MWGMFPYNELFENPILVCTECGNQLIYEPGEAAQCPNHPKAVLMENERKKNIQFYEGCGVIGFSSSQLFWENPETYCKISYDTECGCWMWVEKVPSDRKKGIIMSLEPSDIVEYDGPFIDCLVQTPYHRSGSNSIAYKPSNRVGNITYSAVGGIFGRRFFSCPFETSDYVKASFHPDGCVGIRFTSIPWMYAQGFRTELYRSLIGEVFKIRYEEDKGWMWLKQKIQVIEDYIDEKKKKGFS